MNATFSNLHFDKLNNLPLFHDDKVSNNPPDANVTNRRQQPDSTKFLLHSVVTCRPLSLLVLKNATTSVFFLKLRGKQTVDEPIEIQG